MVEKKKTEYNNKEEARIHRLPHQTQKLINKITLITQTATI